MKVKIFEVTLTSQLELGIQQWLDEHKGITLSRVVPLPMLNGSSRLMLLYYTEDEFKKNLEALEKLDRKSTRLNSSHRL